MSFIITAKNEKLKELLDEAYLTINNSNNS